MTNSKQQPDFDPRFWAELLEALPEALPLLEKLIAIGRCLKAEKGAATEPLPVVSAQNETLQEVCIQLREILRGANRAEEERGKLFDPYCKSLKLIEKHRRADVFEQFERYKDKFKEKAWQTIVWYYQGELSEEQIAEKLGIGRSAVSNRLKRARDKKEQFDKERRREAYEELRKQKKDDV